MCHYFTLSLNLGPGKEIYKPGVETVLENGPPIGRHTFSSDLICQRMLPVPTIPLMVWLVWRTIC